MKRKVPTTTSCSFLITILILPLVPFLSYQYQSCRNKQDKKKNVLFIPNYFKNSLCVGVVSVVVLVISDWFDYGMFLFMFMSALFLHEFS